MDRLIDMLDVYISPLIDDSKNTLGDTYEALEEELTDLIEQNIDPIKSECTAFHQTSLEISLENAMQQGLSVMDGLVAVKELDIICQPLDEAYEEIMDRTYKNWAKNKTEEELSLLNFPLLKARLMLDIGLEEYISYTPSLCVAASKLFPAPTENVIDATPVRPNICKSITALVVGSLFATRAQSKLPAEPATEEECKHGKKA
jgi:hypothetical protein